MALTSSLQGPVQAVILVLIIIFAIQYQQLLQKYDDLASDCKNGQTLGESDQSSQEEHFIQTGNPRLLVHRNTDSVPAQVPVSQNRDVYAALDSKEADPSFTADVADETVPEIEPSSFDSQQIVISTSAQRNILGLAASAYSTTGESDYVEVKATESMPSSSSTLHILKSVNSVTVSTTSCKSCSENPDLQVNPKHQDSSVNKQYEQLHADTSTSIHISQEKTKPVYDDTEVVVDTEENFGNFVGIPTSYDSASVSSSELDIEKSHEVLEINIEMQNPLVIQSSQDDRVSHLVEVNTPNLNSLNVETFNDSSTEETNSVYATSFSVRSEMYSDDKDYDEPEEEEDILSDTASNLLTSSEELVKEIIQEGTTIQCQSQTLDSPVCYSNNLCYNMAERDFIFLSAEKSSMDIHMDESDIDGLFSINLSSVPNHNAQLLRPVTIPSKSLNEFSVLFVEEPSFLISRFKPDNFMHVLHDDVIPLYHSLHSMKFPQKKKRFDIVIAFTDSYGLGDFVPLYSALTTQPLLSLWKQENKTDVICFTNAYFGVSNQTLWYQYGFTTPQGPLPVDEIKVGLNVQRAATHLSHQLFSECMFCHSRNYIVLLSRKDNRLILNEGPLILALAQRTKLKVMSVSLETHSVQEMISIVRNSQGIIGVHGSLLAVAMFLQPGSFVIEIFPFGVNPSNYTPFKTLASLPSMNIIYYAWMNTDKAKSIPHPDRSPDLGGIYHLDADAQRMIAEQKEVPIHFCCEDPSWLYHIYQDTEVNVNELTALVKQSLAQKNVVSSNSSLKTPQREKNTPIRVSPGPVRKLSCYQNSDSDYKPHISWQLPWNMAMGNFQSCFYHIIYQNRETMESESIDLPADMDSYDFEIPIEYKSKFDYNVWISVVCDENNVGFSQYTLCAR